MTARPRLRRPTPYSQKGTPKEDTKVLKGLEVALRAAVATEQEQEARLQAEASLLKARRELDGRAPPPRRRRPRRRLLSPARAPLRRGPAGTRAAGDAPRL
jgi:hypothetical protein